MLGFRSLPSYVLQTFFDAGPPSPGSSILDCRHDPGRQPWLCLEAVRISGDTASRGSCFAVPGATRVSSRHTSKSRPTRLRMVNPRRLRDDTLRFTSPDCIHVRGRAFIASRHPIHMSLRGRLRLLALRALLRI